MSNPFYPVPSDPKYDPFIPSILDTDPVRASTSVNPINAQLIENTHYLRQQIVALSAKIEALTGFSISGSVDGYDSLPDSSELTIGILFVVRNDKNNDGKAAIYEVTEDGWLFVALLEINFSDIEADIQKLFNYVNELNSLVDVAISTRAPADTALSNTTWTDDLAVRLDAQTNRRSGMFRREWWEPGTYEFTVPKDLPIVDVIDGIGYGEGFITACAAGAGGGATGGSSSVENGTAGGSTTFGNLLTLLGGAGGRAATGLPRGIGGEAGGPGGGRGGDGSDTVSGTQPAIIGHGGGGGASLGGGGEGGSNISSHSFAQAGRRGRGANGGRPGQSSTWFQMPSLFGLAGLFGTHATGQLWATAHGSDGGTGAGGGGASGQAIGTGNRGGAGGGGGGDSVIFFRVLLIPGETYLVTVGAGGIGGLGNNVGGRGGDGMLKIEWWV